MNHIAKGPTLSETILDLQDNNPTSHLRAEDLEELDELLKKEADHTTRVLNEMEQRRKLALQDAVNRIKCPHFKQVAGSIIRKIGAECTL